MRVNFQNPFFTDVIVARRNTAVVVFSRCSCTVYMHFYSFLLWDDGYLLYISIWAFYINLCFSRKHRKHQTAKKVGCSPTILWNLVVELIKRNDWSFLLCYFPLASSIYFGYNPKLPETNSSPLKIGRKTQKEMNHLPTDLPKHQFFQG